MYGSAQYSDGSTIWPECSETYTCDLRTTQSNDPAPDAVIPHAIDRTPEFSETIEARNLKKPRHRKRLYYAAKISDYHFRKVLWRFALDHSAEQTARHVRLSANSISLLHAKLRRFFFEAALFTDPYRGGDPTEGLREQFDLLEFHWLDFHLKRVAAKHGSLDTAGGTPDYHFAESCWRHGFEMLKAERGTDLVSRMMFENLLAFVRRLGPVGARRPLTVAQRLEGSKLALQQFDQRIIWLERNSARFKDGQARAELRDMRD